MSRRELVLATAVVRIDGDFLTTLGALDDAGNVIFRNRIDHGDRLDLRDHNQAVGVGCMDDVAGVHLPQAHASADRRGDSRVGKLKLGVVDCALIGCDRALILANQSLLGIDYLL